MKITFWFRVKRVTSTKLPKSPFKIYRLWYADLLLEAEYDFISEHLPDDSDKLAGAVPQSIVMRPDFSSLGIVINHESCIVFYNIMSSIHKGIAKYRRATFWDADKNWIYLLSQ